MTILSKNYFANLCKNLERQRIIDSIMYSQGAKVKDHYLNTRDSKFYDGEYKFDADFVLKCLIKKYNLEKYLMVTHIWHPNIVRLISYDVDQKNVLVEYLKDFGTFETYRKQHKNNFVDEFGDLTKKFREFIRLVLTTLKFLYGKFLAHGHLEAKNILVWEENEEINLKLFEIGVSIKQNDNKSRHGNNLKTAAHYQDFRQLAKLIDETTVNQGNSLVANFIKYLKREGDSGGLTITVDDVLHHPIFTMVTEKDKADYLDNVIESTGNERMVNKSGIRWLVNDFETILRENASTDKTENPYKRDAWSFVRLVRNSVKHYNDFKGATQLDKDDIFAYLKYVLQSRPTLVSDVYEAIGRHLN